MDISGLIKKKVEWIFDDTFKTKVLGIFVKAKNYTTNMGKEQVVFVLSIEGTEYLIMPFKVDYVNFVESFGSNTDDWEGHSFYMSKNSKGKYVLTTIEENI